MKVENSLRSTWGTSPDLHTHIYGVCVCVCYRGSPCWVGWSSPGGWSPVRPGQGPSEQSCRPDQASERRYRSSPCHPPAYTHTHTNTHRAKLIWMCQCGTTREAFFENIIQSWWLSAKQVENLTSSTRLQLADVIMRQQHFTVISLENVFPFRCSIVPGELIFSDDSSKSHSLKPITANTMCHQLNHLKLISAFLAFLTACFLQSKPPSPIPRQHPSVLYRSTDAILFIYMRACSLYRTDSMHTWVGATQLTRPSLCREETCWDSSVWTLCTITAREKKRGCVRERGRERERERDPAWWQMGGPSGKRTMCSVPITEDKLTEMLSYQHNMPHWTPDMLLNLFSASLSTTRGFRGHIIKSVQSHCSYVC